MRLVANGHAGREESKVQAFAPTVRLAAAMGGGGSKWRVGDVLEKKDEPPVVRLAHVPGAQGDNSLLGQRGVEQLPPDSRPALLVSYYYIKPFLENKHRYAYRDWVLDSGAFSAHASGGKIDLQEFIEKATELLTTDPTLTEVFALDVIGDWKATAANCDKMWAAGVPAIPCYHVGSPESELKRIARDYPKIALGGAVGFRGKDEWAKQCFARVWPKRIHGFGFGGETSILGLPWHSVDATNWEMGPCLTADALVSTPEGLRPIGDLVRVGKFSVNTHTQAVVPECVAIESGIKETLAVTLNTGQVIRCTPDHRILTAAALKVPHGAHKPLVAEEAWRRADELTIGSRVRIVDQQLRAPVLADNLRAELLGWFTGDGWFSESNGRTSAGIVFANPGDLDAMHRLLPEWDAFVGSSTALLEQKGVFRKASESKSVVTKLCALGFKPATATKKELPDFIYTAPAEEQLAFLRGLFSADGGLRKDGSGLHRMIVLACSSRRMIRQVQVLLLEFGIQSHINWNVPEGRNEQGQLVVSGRSARRFMEVIGFNLRAKAARFQAGAWTHRPVTYAKVVAIEPGIAEPVYDVVMPRVHHFVANGVVVHNCAFGNWRTFGKMSVRGSKQNLRAEVEWYLKLERRARQRWKREMVTLEALPPVTPPGAAPIVRLAVANTNKNVYAEKYVDAMGSAVEKAAKKKESKKP